MSTEYQVTVEVDDDGSATAYIHNIFDDGESGDTLDSAYGDDVGSALTALGQQIERGSIAGDLADPCRNSSNGVAHSVTDGSCDECGAKNFD